MANYEEKPIPEIACHFALRLARLHPFQDGNKRLAYLATRLLARLNGYQFEQKNWNLFAEAIVARLSRELASDEEFVERVAPLFQIE